MGIWKCRECGKIQEGSNLVTNGKCKYCKKYYVLIRYDPDDDELKELNKNQRKEKLFKIRNSILIFILIGANIPLVYFIIKYPKGEVTFQIILYLLFQLLGLGLIGISLKVTKKKKKVDLIKFKEKWFYIKYKIRQSIRIGLFSLLGWIMVVSLMFMKNYFISIFISGFYIVVSWITFCFTIFLSIMFVIFLNSDIASIRRGLERMNKRKIKKNLSISFLNLQEIFECEIDKHLIERKCSFCDSELYFYRIYNKLEKKIKMEVFFEHWNDETNLIFCTDCVWNDVVKNLAIFYHENKPFKILPYQLITDKSIEELLKEHGFKTVKENDNISNS